ncbi:MAG: gfo/Idh/MocA family oxidoreductase [Armatimonadetes bacterium]|nr:gfo/Idh/MocA family oxidoreductase [Armatimonadota bacterium]MBS1727717.1 Gfo/Idh/MocA family oxidoreductase [Armatimonadota bacterium]
MSSPVNLAWVGVAHIHTPGFSNEVLKRGHKCAGVYDHDAAKAAKNAETLGGKVRTIAEMAADSSVDAFIVTSETCYHLDLVKQIADAGKPIFVEKPLGISTEFSTSILEILEDKKITFQTGYFQRGGAAIQTLKKNIDGGHFGTITRVRASICHSGALGGWFDTDWRWMADRKLAGVGAYGDLGTHGLDLLMWLFGGVKAATGALSMGTARYEGCDELGEGLLKFTNGIIGTLTASWDDVANPIRMQVTGTQGHALLNGELKLAGPDGKLEVVTALEPGVSAGFPGFLDFLEGKKVDLVKPREAVARDIVMDAIYKGAETQSWIDICSDWH